MKRWKLIELIINYIYHDNIYLMSPIVDWNLMAVINGQFKNNYQKVRPILQKWQDKGYITLIEDSEVVFIFHPEKLTTKEKLKSESSEGNP